MPWPYHHYHHPSPSGLLFNVPENVCQLLDVLFFLCACSYFMWTLQLRFLCMAEASVLLMLRDFRNLYL